MTLFVVEVTFPELRAVHQQAEGEQTLPSTVAVLKLEDAGLEWVESLLRFDETPETVGPARKHDIYASPDGRVKVYFWQRDQDIGKLNPNVEEPEGLTKFDIILEGEVEVTDSENVTHTARAGSVLYYKGTDTGRWVQRGRLVKLAISIRD